MMRKGCLLLMLALSGPGCLSSAKHVEAPPPVRVVEAPPPPAPPTVTADQVNEANAAEMAQALAREMEYDATVPQPAPAMVNAGLSAPDMIDLTPATKAANANKIKP